MSDTTYLSNSSLVQNGDLFKIMELRYSHSIFDKNGCFNTISPISNSLELIRWYRNCEDFFYQLSVEGTPPSENDFASFQAELDKLIVKDEVLGNFGITEYSQDCRQLYSNLRLREYRNLVLKKHGDNELTNWLKEVYPVRKQLKSLAKHEARFDLDIEYQSQIEDLQLFLKNAESAYFLAFDIEIEAKQFKGDVIENWRENAVLLKPILENALNDILKAQSDTLRFCVKFEDDGIYGFRFHVVIFLQFLTLTESAWLAEFNDKLQHRLSDKVSLNEWLKLLYTKKINVWRNHRDLNKLTHSEENLDKVEQCIYSNFQDYQHDITFKIINWNEQLKTLQPVLKFEIDDSFSNEDRQKLEYWGIKYLFISSKYMYFQKYHEDLHPSIVSFVYRSPTSKHKIVAKLATSEIQEKDSRPSGEKKTEKPKQSIGKKIQAIKEPVIQQRRTDVNQTYFYNATLDFTKNMPLADVAESKAKPKFQSKTINKIEKLHVGAPKSEDVIDPSKILTLQDFIDYVLDKKNGIWKTEIKNKQRASWAEIFFKNKIRDVELLAFLIRFERFLDTLLNTANPYFAIVPKLHCNPEGMTIIGGQYLSLLYDFHTQHIENKLNELNIRSDYWVLITKMFESRPDEEYQSDVSQLKMHHQQVQKINGLMKKARVLVKEYQKKMQQPLTYLKYADAKLWQKAFNQECILMRWQFNLPSDFNINEGLMSLFNKFKTRLSGKERHFKDVQHILLECKRHQSVSLDVVLIFDSAELAENQNKLSEHVIELWTKTVQAEMKKQENQMSYGQLEDLAHSISLISKHEQLAEKYIFVKNSKMAKDKLVISDLIPFFISQAIFLQEVSSNQRYKLSMSQYLTNLFVKKSNEKKDVLTGTVKSSKTKKLIAD
ncbi:hypothetical protein NCZ17_00240 [Acinetobacter modestus]|uniref:hypothetical protein n=1 Tax=Acinetobacter modestus TaxID=1776740 RepID=UPI002030339F|nr:hypothetical protein [Acinetobacter modestus]MCM1957804.1 hypothetical protein [Acinetobacter modestus]